MRVIILTCLFAIFGFKLQYIQQEKSLQNKQDVINSYVEEVFQNYSQELVFNNRNRFQLIKNFISRTSIVPISTISDTKYINLLELSLQNKYNKTLTHDKDYSLGQYFNPLKYDLPMFPKNTKYYKIGNSKFLLIVETVKK